MTHANLARTIEGRLELLKVLELDIVLYKEAIERNKTSFLLHDIPLAIRVLNAIQIGLLEQS